MTDDRSRFIGHGSTDIAGEFSIAVQRTGSYRVQWQQRGGRMSVEERAGVSMNGNEPIALREGGRAASYRPFAGAAQACGRAGFSGDSDVASAEAVLRGLLAATSLRAADSVVSDVVQYDLARTRDDGTMRVLSVVEGRAAAGAILDALLPAISGSLEAEWKGLLCPASPSRLRERYDAVSVGIGPFDDSASAVRAAAVLWLDRETGAVGAVTPLDGDPRAPRPEATLDLVLLPTGHIVLRRWRLVIPVDSAGDERMRGGTLAAIVVRGLPRLQLPVPTVRVRLAEASRALKGASVAILDGGPVADFDAGGTASIPVGVEGNYFVEVAAPELEAIGVAPTVALSHARLGADAPDIVALPLPSDLRSVACGLGDDDRSGVLVRIQVVGRAGAARPSALRVRPVPADALAGALTASAAAQSRALNSSGRTFWCAARSSGAWMLEAGDGVDARRQLVRMPASSVDTAVTFGLTDESRAESPVPLRSRSTLRVIVADSLGARLPSVSIRLFDSTGVRIDGRMDSDGASVFGELHAAPTILEVRAVGFAPGTATVSLREGDNEVTMVLRRNFVVQLDPVYIRELPNLLSRHGEFERRRRFGFAAAMYTAEDIRRRNPLQTWELFRTTRSVKLVGGPDGLTATSARGLRIQREGPLSNCVMRIAIDGVFLARPASLETLPAPGEIYGIEVYSGPASIPVEYRQVDGSNCGLILIWTK